MKTDNFFGGVIIDDHDHGLSRAWVSMGMERGKREPRASLCPLLVYFLSLLSILPLGQEMEIFVGNTVGTFTKKLTTIKSTRPNTRSSNSTTKN
jgi:hypothetical protein